MSSDEIWNQFDLYCRASPVSLSHQLSVTGVRVRLEMTSLWLTGITSHHSGQARPVRNSQHCSRLVSRLQLNSTSSTCRHLDWHPQRFLVCSWQWQWQWQWNTERNFVFDGTSLSLISAPHFGIWETTETSSTWLWRVMTLRRSRSTGSSSLPAPHSSGTSSGGCHTTTLSSISGESSSLTSSPLSISYTTARST